MKECYRLQRGRLEVLEGDGSLGLDLIMIYAAKSAASYQEIYQATNRLLERLEREYLLG